MALKMSQADENIGIHNGTADLCGLDILAAVYRHFYIIGSL